MDRGRHIPCPIMDDFFYHMPMIDRPLQKGPCRTCKMFTGKLCYCLVIVLLCVLCPIDTPSSAETITLTQLIARIQQTYDETEDFTGHFIQKATITTINRTVTEEGTLYLKKPRRMFWDYTKPALKKLILNPRKAWLYLPDEHMVYIQDTKTLLTSKMTIRFLSGIGDLKDDFEVSFSTPESRDERGNYRITLVPRHHETGVTRLLLTIDKDSYFIIGFTFIDMYENTTDLTFQDVITNTGIPETMFTFTPPPGVDIYTIP